MIRIVHIEMAGPAELDLSFSDGATARWSAEPVLARNTVMTQPLGDPAYFARVFIEAGALAWPNGLEFSATALHRRLDESGALVRKAA